MYSGSQTAIVIRTVGKNVSPNESQIASDSVLQVMEWKNGIAQLPGTNLKVRLNQFGALEVVKEDQKPKAEDDEKSCSTKEATTSDSTTAAEANANSETKKDEPETENPTIKVEAETSTTSNENIEQPAVTSETDKVEDSIAAPIVSQKVINDSEKTESAASATTTVKKFESRSQKEDVEFRTCLNCGVKGFVDDFIRQGRFCSKECATIVSSQLKLIAKNLSTVPIANAMKKKEKAFDKNKKIDTMKMRRMAIEKMEREKETIIHISRNGGDDEMESVDGRNDADEESNAGNSNDAFFSMSSTKFRPGFSWKMYLTNECAHAAPLKCFNEAQTYPTIKNNFKVGMKLEGVDPQHPSKFCVLTVAEVAGFRIRLHFDGYRDIFDFWVNSDSPFIFPVGWCLKTGRRLEPPGDRLDEEFSWSNYLTQTRAVAAPKSFFSINNALPNIIPNGFRVGMKLEAVDRANCALVCVATIADIIDNWLLIHFDGWDDSYDYWTETTSPYIHPINWCRNKGRSLTPPKDYPKSSERFSWEEYLQETKSNPVSPRSFKTRTSNNFNVGMKLEAVDKRNPKLIRVATISHRQGHNIKIHFDNWDEKYDYWVDDDSPDIHPVNWCARTGHSLQPPPSEGNLDITFNFKISHFNFVFQLFRTLK